MSPKTAWILQEEVVPRLKTTIPRTVNQIGSEDAEELVQDSICFAARLLDNAERANKKVTPGNISFFTSLHMRSGRRSYGSSTVDALGVGAQLNGRSTTTSFDEPAMSEEGEEFLVGDVLSSDAEDPGTIAARNLDWDGFLTGLSSREKSIVEKLLAGLNSSEVARSLKVDPSTIRYFKQRLAVKILDHFGQDILRVIVQRPGWKNGLVCERERLACKSLRRN
jgi:DNA-directed RNA polymerase specialized sigma24 family protein